MNPKLLEVLEACHQRAHECPDDPEDYMLLALTESQFWVMILGCLLVASFAPCLEDDVVELQEKVAGARREQKPAWIARYDPDAT